MQDRDQSRSRLPSSSIANPWHAIETRTDVKRVQPYSQPATKSDSTSGRPQSPSSGGRGGARRAYWPDWPPKRLSWFPRQDQRRILPAEAERVGHDRGDAGIARLIADHVERNRQVRVLVVEGRRD